ncbi:MAG TPA: RNA 2',3'-cyclic phosphodiesterase [Vicinamibacterales bacterium]|nr:RNA 2',3'-cyclic phosphodiesterase [Vicinamibacterales bacterium]
MRLFVAAEIDDATRQQLAAAREALRSVLSEARVPPRVTWVTPATAHVTLRFIGEASEETAAHIQAALAGLALAPFDVTWGTIGTFGGSRNPSVIRVAPTGGLESFRRLAQQVNERLDPVIGAGGSRPFAPHLTLARVKQRGAGVNWTRALQAIRWTPIVARIERVTLYQSRLSPKGPTYTALSTHG